MTHLTPASSVLADLLPEEPARVAPMISGNNQLFKVEMADGRSYALKCFERRGHHAFEKEISVRQLLRSEGRLHFAQILASKETGD